MAIDSINAHCFALIYLQPVDAKATRIDAVISTPVSLDVTCRGDEAKLVSCPYSRVGVGVKSCHYSPAGVICPEGVVETINFI